MNDSKLTSIIEAYNIADEDAAQLRELLTSSAHYKTELQRLQSARGTYNRRKANRIARRMVEEGAVQ